MMDVGICNVPALKNRSGKIEMKNIWDRENLPDYIFYTEGALYDDSVASSKIQTWENNLRTCGNFCPQCNKYTLTFEMLGMFD